MTVVLVVDDSAVDRHLAASLLRQHSQLDVLEADGGATALRLLEEQPIDVVVTDLQMPEVTGLDLVRQARTRFPHTAVVIITSQGSEEFAIEALRSGAASYLPKARMAQDLHNTIEHVLAASRADRSHEQLLDSLQVSESHFTIANDPDLVPPLVEHLRDELIRMRICDEAELTRIGIAVHESLVNAIDHGNLELSSDLREDDDRRYHALANARRAEKPYSDRRVHFQLRVTRDEARCMVTDEGPGFDPSKLPDPTDPANLERVFGRGLLLIRTFMDDVFHNERGNQITMVKRRQ